MGKELKYGLSLSLALLLAACTVVNKLDQAVQSLTGGESKAESKAETASTGQDPAPETADAAFHQGVRYKEGDGVAQSDEKAATYFRQAADAGHADAQFLLGLALQTGRGVAKDPAEALSWYRKAGVQGHTEGQFLAGLMHRRGLGTKKDPVAAFDWFRRAAAQDHTGAQFQLGLAYAKGEGVAEDDARALEYFEAAAGRGHAEAMFVVADAYSNGRGVAKDHAWAARWYGRAARLGVARAQYMLGVGFGAGLGLPRVPGEAYFWLILAADRGAKGAVKLRDAVKGLVKPKRRAEVEGRAAAWKPKTETPEWDRPSIRFMQTALDGLGYPAGPIDGILGAKTKKALAKYQKDRRLAANARLSTEILERLRDERRTIAGN